MTHCRWTLVAVAVLALPLGGAPARADEADIAAVKGVLARFDEAYAKKDIDGIATTMATDTKTVFFGLDVGDRWVGWAAIRTGLSAEFRGVKSASVSAQPASVHVQGGVAWFERSLVLNLVIEQGEMALFARSTGVLEKRGGSWLVVQMHTSVGAPKDSTPRD